MKSTRVRSNASLAVTATLALAIGLGAFAGANAAAPKIAGSVKPTPLAAPKAAMAKGNFKAALAELETYIQKNPQSAEAQYLAGEASYKIGDKKKAAGYLRTARRLGKGGAFSQKANALMMKLPSELTRPRTGPETRMLASMFGISKLRGGEPPRPTVIDFYAPWCQPCRDMDKALEKVKKEYGDKISLMKVDIDDPKNEKLVDQYEVSPIPTLVFLNTDGEVVTYTIGYAENNVTDGLKKILDQ